MDERITIEVNLDETTKLKWYQIVFSIKKQFGKKPDLNGLLYLIGLRELGTSKELNKDQKMDAMHIATCALLAQEGYYILTHTDEDGWPHYQQLKTLPYTDLLNQENYLKHLIVQYFETNNLIE
jgi:hypothetical protein